MSKEDIIYHDQEAMMHLGDVFESLTLVIQNLDDGMKLADEQQINWAANTREDARNKVKLYLQQLRSATSHISAALTKSLPK